MASTIQAKASINGAKQFQDDLKRMTARSKALDAEMKEMTARFEASGKAMGDDAKARELSNKQIEAQKEKIALLSDQLKKLEAAGQGESKQAYELREKIAKANTELVNMEHSSEKAASGQKSLTGQMLKANLGATAITTALKGVVSVMKGMVTAAGRAAKAVWNLGVESGQWADALITQSNQTGVDTETLQEWEYAARFVDTEVSTMTKGMTKLTKAYAKGTASKKKSVKLSKGVVVSLRNENGELKTQSEFYLDTIDALHNMTNTAQRNRAAQEIFGKSYTDMLPLINSGTAAIREYAAEARSMGIIITADNVGALGRFDDQMQRFDATMNAIKTNLAVAFLPVLELVSGRLTEFTGKVSSALSDGFQKDDVSTIVDAFFDMFRTDNGDPAKQDESIFSFIGDVVQLLAAKVGEHSDDIKRIATTIFTYIGEGFKEALGITGLKEKIFGEEGTFFGFKVEEGSIADRFIQWAKGAADAFHTGFLQGEKETSQYSAPGDATYDSLQDRLDSAQAKSDYNSWGVDAVTGFGDGMTSAQGEVEAAAEETVGAVEKKTGPSAKSKTTHWGKEAGQGYADGIEAAIPQVSAAARKLAAAASGPIHFSKPDYGPLRNVGAWGGEMIDQYVAGIKANAWKVSSAMGSSLGLPNVNPAIGGSTTNYGGVTIVVNGAAGQDVNQLADIVMMKMQSAVSRREAVFA